MDWLRECKFSRVYANERHECLVVSSAWSDGVGAVVCRICNLRRKHIQIRRIPCFFIDGNEAGDYFTGMRADDMYRPTCRWLSIPDTVYVLRVALVKLRKTHDRNNFHYGYFREEVASLIIHALDTTAALLTDMITMKRLINSLFGSCLIKTIDAFDCVAIEEAEKRCLIHKVRMIQRRWREANTNPSFELCKRRLMHEYVDLT